MPDIAGTWKAERRALLGDRSRAGTQLGQDLTEQVDGWLMSLASGLPAGMALMATAGYARRELCPGSDLDLCLVHDPRVDPSLVASHLWYPLWDAGLTTKPLTHTVDSAIAMAETDLVMATTLLSIRHLAGDPRLTDALGSRALLRWRANRKRRLAELANAVEARHRHAGEVAYLLEPNLKEGRGGLRDVHALAWAAASNIESDLAADPSMCPSVDLSSASSVLFAVRVELHRPTGRANDRLLLQEQDGVASVLGYSDADELMRAVADAARQIAWTSDGVWRAIRNALTRRRGWRIRKPIPLARDVELLDGEVWLTGSASPVSDSSLLLRAAALAAQASALLSPAAVVALADVAALPDPWTDELRNAFVTLIGAGPSSLPVIEALDQAHLFERILPEWRHVRSKPQRNAFHRYTVDRHLVQTAVNAAALVRQVARPDLLLVGALLHDIGKGYPGDHTEAGEPIVRAIALRMGFNQADVETIVSLERHHLLLPELATRRDIADPGTIAAVTNSVGDIDHLDLLCALTEADSLATGPTAWTDWKAGLVRRLVAAAAAAMQGHRPPDIVGFPAPHHLGMLGEVRADSRAHLHVSGELCTVVAPDRTGLFNTVAGVLSLHNVDVLAADVWTADDGIALEEYRIVRRLGGETNWKRVESDLRRALDGALAIDVRLQEKVAAYESSKRRPTAASAARAEVSVDNSISSVATVVEVRAPDGLAVLYRLTEVLARFGIDVRHAKIATLGHEVVDVFYVTRLADEEQIAALKAALLASVGT